MLPVEVAHLIRDFVPLHPLAKIIQDIPPAAFEALRVRYASPCECCDWYHNVAVRCMSWGGDPAYEYDLYCSERCIRRQFADAFKHMHPCYKPSWIVKELRGEWWGLDFRDHSDSD